LVLLVATALRLVAAGEIPPGLYHDEAYNGLDALKVLDGDLPLYFAANNGREPMFVYLVALSVGLLGRSPFAVRLAAFAPGLLTVAATYALARALFSRRVGLLSAAVLSVTLWHVHLSRVGFRSVLLPLFITLALWQGALGWRSGRRRHWLAAGALYGLTFYTYIAARFTLVALILFGLYHLTRPSKTNPQSPISWASLAFLLALAPLTIFTLLHPDLVLTRTGQVSIWNPDIHGGDFWGTLAKHTTRTLGMFFWRGDRIWRHNVPWRPVFDPLLGAFFVIGLVRALRGLRRDPRLALLVIWTATMTLPTLLAEDAPHFLRGVGVLPLVVLFPALGMDWGLRSMEYGVWSRRGVSRPCGTPHVLRFAPCVILVVALASTTAAYFGDYARADTTGYWFEEGTETLAGRVNSFLGVGWDGERMLHGSPGARQVYVEPGLWEEWTALPFLVRASPAVHLLPTNRGWPAVGSGPTAIFVWPYGNWKRVWPMLNAAAEIRVTEGALSQGDRDPEPYTTDLAFYITPVEALPPVMARFQGGVELVGATAQARGQDVRVELLWHATARLPDDYAVFVHYLRDGDRIAQGDAHPAGGHYPTQRWRAGDLIHDQHAITLPGPPDPARDQIWVGFYHPASGQRLDVLDQANNPAGTFVALPVSEILR
jgi:4-amino-4-deoxy-L-arabinose transferase-like glycosyltransferase